MASLAQDAMARDRLWLFPMGRSQKLFGNTFGHRCCCSWEGVVFFFRGDGDIMCGRSRIVIGWPLWSLAYCYGFSNGFAICCGEHEPSSEPTGRQTRRREPCAVFPFESVSVVDGTTYWRMRASTSSRRASISSRLLVLSRLRRTSGSVLEQRTLNHQVGYSTLTPSSSKMWPSA